MKKSISKTPVIILQLAACAVLSFGFVCQSAAQDKKVDGTWTWTTRGRQDGTERKMTLKLKSEDGKLTGKLTMPARDGQTRDTEIQDGKIKGEEISFNIVREFNGNKMTSKYTGKLAGDTIKGKMEFERNGETMSRDWEAKRETEKK